MRTSGPQHARIFRAHLYEVGDRVESLVDGDIEVGQDGLRRSVPVRVGYRGTISRVDRPGRNSFVWVCWDVAMTMADFVPADDLRRLGILDLMAEAAQD